MSSPDDEIDVKFECTYRQCAQPEERRTFEKRIKKYQLGLVAIWFHSSHEGHNFRYTENGDVILG